MQKYFDVLVGAEPWQRVEAVRHALFNSTRDKGSDLDHLGNGALQAAEALNVGFDASKLSKRAPDDISFALFKELFGMPSLLKAADATGDRGIGPEQQHMLEVEGLQLVMLSPLLGRIVGEADLESDSLDSKTRQKLVEAMIADPATSRTLRGFLTGASAKLGGPGTTP